MINFEVVLASGEIVQANQQSNRDLFEALKGGSNNFSNVTRVDLPASQLGKMWDGAIFYDCTAYAQLVQAFYNFTAAIDADETAHVIVGTSFSGGHEACVSNLYHSKPQSAPS